MKRIGPFEVSKIGLGAMPMSIEHRPAENDSVGVIHAALDAGVTLIDTADCYCLDEKDFGHGERLVRRALSEWTGDKDRIVVATKGGLERPGGAWATNGRPERLKAACEASCRALGVSAIALYQLHAPDDRVPFEDSIGALADLKREGKIRSVGLSNVSVEHIERARKIVDIVSVQNRCNVFDQQSFASGVIAYCQASGIAFLAHSPVGGHRGKSRIASAKTLRSTGERHGVSAFRVALAWLLSKEPVIIPIPGASRATNAVDSAGAMSLVLSPGDIQRIEDELASYTIS